MKLKLTFLLTLTILLFSCKEEKKDNRNLFLGVAALASQAGSGQITATHKATARITDKATGAVIANATINFTHGSTRNVPVTSTVTTDANGLFEFLMSGFVVTLRILKADGTAFTGEATLKQDPNGGFPKVTYSDGTEFSIEMTSFRPLTTEELAGGGTVATPTFSPTAGHYNTAQNITISSTTSGSAIHYTIDGSDPSSTSSLFGSGMHIWSLAGKTIKAIAVKSGLTNSSVLTGVFSYPPLKTGAGTIPSYTLVTGEDGLTQNGVAKSYTDNGNGTVTDNSTGLIWQKCNRGQNNDGTCSGAATKATWTEAGNYCNSLNLGNLTWRLPTRKELNSLFDHGKTTPPIINTSIFPATQSSSYWTSTNYAVNTNFAWTVYFSWGDTYFGSKDNTEFVRCVSGARTEYSGNFSDNGDGTVKDNTTGLVWQKCSRGQTGNNCSGTISMDTWVEAVNYCRNLDFANRTWRLPSINELESLVDTGKSSSPLIDVSFFPNTSNGNYYWSSTTYAGDVTKAHHITFSDGTADYTQNKTTNQNIRCVSGP